MALGSRGRDPVKRDEIMVFVRGQIFGGAWAPGEKLPPRTWFETRFGAANHTVQNAFALLAEDGFLVAEERIGTRVHPELPPLRRYALLLYGTPELRSYHPRALFAAAEALRAQGRDIRIHFDLEREFDDPEHLRLLADIRRHYYAGVFYETPPPGKQRNGILSSLDDVPFTGFIDTVFAREPNVVPLSAEPGKPNLASQDIDTRQIRYLAECGARRIACLSLAFFHEEGLEHEFRLLAEQHGMRCPPGYYLEFRPEALMQARNVLRILLAPDNPNRPDGLLVANDNFLPHVADILKEFYGDSTLAAIRITSRGNYPALPETGLDVRFFGIDMVKTLEGALCFIDDFRAKRPAHIPKIELFES